ncbi:MAG: DNA polymerase I, partial [Alphaproteobacteria bacterium]
MTKKNLYLLDGSGYIFRAYYALPPLTRSDGLPTGAIYGFCQMLLNILDKKPANIAVVFDSARINFRHDIYPQYKSNRGEPPEDLIPQFPFFRAVANALSLPTIEEKNFEADDIIATLAMRSAQQGYQVRVYSSDKDLMQIINDNITLIDPFKNREIDKSMVLKKFGVTPDKVADVQALMGDASDGFPGLPGIGPKTAATLINQFGNLEKLLKSPEKIENQRQQDIVKTHSQQAKIFYQLATLRCDVPLSLNPNQLSAPLNPSVPQQMTALKFFEELEFKKLAKKWREKFNLYDDKTNDIEKKPTPNKTIQTKNTTKPPLPNKKTEPHLPDKKANHFTPLPINKNNIKNLINDIKKFGRCGFLLTNHHLAIGLENGDGFILVLNHEKDKSDLLTNGKTDELPSLIKYILHNPSIKKFNHEVTSTIVALNQLEKNNQSYPYFMDVSVLHFCLFAGAKNDDMENCGQSFLERFIKEKAKEKNTLTISLEQQLCFMPYQFLRLGIFYEESLARQKLTRIYQQIERPLLPILAMMEKTGIAIDNKKFGELGKQTEHKLINLEKKIFATLGQAFNLSSPKQLGDILFNDKKIDNNKIPKTKTGQFSTSSDVLESLTDDYPVVADILEHRHLEKLNNTYIRALPLLARPHQHGQMRLHTHFSSTGAQTGRLSSLNPNLQNIPIRTEQGAELRECFIAAPNRLLLSLDYNQIELRILALLSGASALKKAFLANNDIHKSTASEIFDTPLDNISPELRFRAKAVNFGIIYGISPFGLAKQLQISSSEAKEIIESYKKKLPAVTTFMDNIIATTEKNGFVETLFGRRIYLPAIYSKGPAKAYARRQAMNAPLQG